MSRRFFYALILFIAGMASPVNAGLKIDASALVSRIKTSAGDGSESATKQVDVAIEEALEKKTLGQKLKAKYETVKALTADVQNLKNEASGAYMDTMGNVQGVTDKYEEEMNSLKQSEAGKSVSLKKQLDDINQQIEDRRTVLAEENGAKRKSAEQNLKILQEMYEASGSEQAKNEIATQMAATQAELDVFIGNGEDLKKEDSSFLNNDSEYLSLIEQQNRLQSELAETALAAGSMAANYIKGLLKKDDAQKLAEYNDVIEKNFLLPGEPENSKTYARISGNRQKVLIKDIVHAFYTGADLKMRLDKQLEDGQLKQENMAAVDYKLTSGNLLVEQRIEEIKTLYNYTNLLIADLRLKTSRNMFRQPTRLRNYEKNPAVLNLDNYVFTKDDIKSDEGQKSFIKDLLQ